jgi:predicted acyltransferase
MSTALYLLGFVVLIAGLAWAASVLGVPSLWITIGIVVVAGIAIISLAGNLQRTETDRRPPSDRPPPAA